MIGQEIKYKHILKEEFNGHELGCNCILCNDARKLLECIIEMGKDQN